MTAMKKMNLIKQPLYRKLRGYAFDPSLSLKLDTIGINEITYYIPWENDLKPGPEGEYIKVIDRDPSSNETYTPVDLNQMEILADNGITPNVSNPQFHQQMVYAVAMNTITNFEKAIGRKVMWSPKNKDQIIKKNDENEKSESVFVKQLIIYPHALREANAYYSPERKALLFGYFNAAPANVDLFMPGSLVYSCLSHDIIAHEVTHAILDGIFRHYMDQTNPDVGAFHEGFSDIVALFQHFTFPEVLKNQIAKSRGKFDAENLLGQLAVEFGIASGGYGALRDAIGTIGEKNGIWSLTKPDVNAYSSVFEPHDRGSILVAAVFDAYINIYNHRTEDLIRIGTNGTGILPLGSLNPDLVNRLADEASKTAFHVLNMCIRALDYCPPIDINYGDYLRALITADVELVADDDKNYRIAFINAFKKWGIYPEGISNLSVETLTYSAEEQPEEFKEFSLTLKDFLRDFKNRINYVTNREEKFEATLEFITGSKSERSDPEAPPAKGLHEYFFNQTKNNSILFEKLTGLIFSDNYKKLNIKTSGKYRTGPSIEIHSIRLNNRVSPDGSLLNQIIITLAQRCCLEVVYDEMNDNYSITTFPFDKKKVKEEGCFIFRGGCTLIFDLNTLQLTNVISKPIFDVEKFNNKKRVYTPNINRAKMQYRCSWGDYAELTGFAAVKNSLEPFAHIHKSKTDIYG